eukprot:Hpha_TRINITY_DN14527_c0_g1::TRINITY_DN14527_c0_g1_i1::g.46921::m.46921/K10689/PEX4; peroxin-4
MTARRLQKEIDELRKNGGVYDGGAVKLEVDEKRDRHTWHASLTGPEDTPYQGYSFQVKIRLSTEYPWSPPQAHFVTKILHPNVHFDTGEICLDVLKREWSPAWTVQSVCQAIRLLMGNPEADSPLNCDAGNMLRNGDLRAFERMARMYAIDEAKRL